MKGRKRVRSRVDSKDARDLCSVLRLSQRNESAWPIASPVQPTDLELTELPHVDISLGRLQEHWAGCDRAAELSRDIKSY